MTEFGDALAGAINASKNDITRFTWKDSNGKSILMMDMSPEELQKAWDHCESMLYNKNKWNPGKYVIQNNIKNLYNNCNAELFLRYILYERDIPALKTNKDVLDLINVYRKEENLQDSDFIEKIFISAPPIYKDVTIKSLVRACLECLEPINKNIIPDKFILSVGIWLTDEEKEDLTEYDEKGNKRNFFDVIKERLFLKNVKLRVDVNGLTYNEFRSLMLLKNRTKMSNATTELLYLLRDKILLLLNNDLSYHINKWLDLKNKIQKVCDYKKIKLKSKK